MKLIPPKETQTLDDLKEIGFDCLNIVEVKTPAFYFNRVTLEIVKAESLTEVPDGLHIHMVYTQRIFPDDPATKELLKWLNKQKLIAWYPCKQPGTDIAHWVRLAVLIKNEDIT